MPIVSDNLGFGSNQLQKMEAERRAGGHDGIKFKPDPNCPEFIQVHCENANARDRYMKDRGYVDRGRKTAKTITVDELSSAEEMVRRMYGGPGSVDSIVTGAEAP